MKRTAIEAANKIAILGTIIFATVRKIRLPSILVFGPIATWVFSFAETTPAMLFLIWAILISGCDSFLKPILMGREVDAPMLVILIGAVVVAITYTLFMAWIVEENPNDDFKNNTQMVCSCHPQSACPWGGCFGDCCSL